ncbi:3-hydroxyacyl-CoA dehydrogenase/enoyl-CoA hydratase family protein [Sulfoacidibacillus thermotolerans]|nr:3-hydroxyacyl-CoA dehydrogenase/enoyl-CoA hydratase family protein [Sulfoacidibacillus thermotolerans]
MSSIRRAAILGSGVMGAAIAAHLANVGIPSLLLDIVPNKLTPEEEKKGLSLEDKVVRNRIVNSGKVGLLKAKPAPLYHTKDIDLIETGNFEDDFERIAECDWIIEVVVERLDIKRQVLAKVDEYRRKGSIVSSNTSGVSITAMAEGRSEDFRQHFLGTHFFNPPRYMKLLELIPTVDTLPQVIAQMRIFAEDVLGKGVVIAKDTPNFIANRIGTYGLLITFAEMQKTRFGVDEVDLLTGPVLGRPKSATFRTLDIVGIDTFVHVAQNVYDQSTDPEEKAVFEVPTVIRKMVDNGWIGEKSGQGFFKREKTAQGREIFALDIDTMEYRPRRKLSSASFEAAKAAPSLKKKLQTLAYGEDDAAIFVWNVIKQTLLYSARLVGVIADDITAIDDAMKWGFNWDMGPFELWDAIGVRRSVERMKQEGLVIPEFVEVLLTQGETFYTQRGQTVQSFFVGHGYKEVKPDERKIDLRLLKENGHVVFGNKGASLVDLGDGVACLELHSLKQAIGADVVTMMMKAADEVEKNFEALIVSSEASNFSVGANLMMILMEAQDDNWDEIDLAVRQFQNANMRLKYLKKPVVVAPHGLTLGGGAEIALAGSALQMAAETYCGLVEVGVGLIPGGGGNKELLIRMMERLPEGTDLSPVPLVQKAFEVIAMAKVSTSAKEAAELGFLRPTDQITVARDQLLAQAKATSLKLAENFVPRRHKGIKVLGENAAAYLMIGVYGMKKSGYISEHDEKIARHLIRVLTGGQAAGGSVVSEQYLLDLEREAFLSLCGEPKTQARMQYMLQKGKPLRN